MKINRSRKLTWGQFARQPVDWLMGMVILATITNLFVTFGVVLGSESLFPVTATLALLSVIYILINFKDMPINRNRAILFGIFLVGLPAVSLLYSPIDASREIWLQIYYFLLFLSSSIYFYRRRSNQVLIFLALVITVTSGTFSILRPELFTPLLEMTDAKSVISGRAFGLYLQPNKFAENMVWLLLMVFLSFHARKNVWFWCLCTITMLFVLLTGSRGGTIAALFALFGLFSFNGPRFQIGRFVKSAIGPGMVLFAVTLLFLSPPSYLQNYLFQGQSGEVVERIKDLTQPSELMDDTGTVGSRLDAQKRYISYLTSDRIIWGYGLGAAAYYRETGMLGLYASHNQFIEHLFAYGIVGILILLVCGRQIWLDLKQLSIILNFQIHVLFIGVIFLLFLVSNTILGSRSLYVLLGFLYAQRSTRAVKFLGYALSRDSITQRTH